MNDPVTASISDYDGVSVAVGKCKICKLNFDQKYSALRSIEPNLCIPCRNLSNLLRLSGLFSRMLTPSVILVIFLLISPPLRQYWAYPLLVAIIPLFLLSMLQMRLHYWKVLPKFRIVNTLIMYDLLNDSKYYSQALKAWKMYYPELGEIIQIRILEELTKSVITKSNYNPANLFEDWAEPTGEEASKLVFKLFAQTDLDAAFGVTKGLGLLPDIWKYLTTDDSKNHVLDLLLESLEDLIHAGEREKKIFVEDLFLLEEELEEHVTVYEKYQPLLDEIDKFEPDTPPKSFIQQAQMLAQESAKP